jgi:integrase
VKLVKIDGRGNENLYKHPESEIIYIDKFKTGKGRITRSTGTKNINEARRKRDEWLGEFLSRRKHLIGGKRLCGELLVTWLATKGTKSYYTHQRYAQCVAHLKPLIKNMTADEITNEWWLSEYVPFKRKHFGVGRKFFNERKTLLAFLKSLYEQTIIDRMPKIENPDPKSDIGRVITDSEIERLLSNAEPDLRLQIEMALRMFMRRGEILQLASDRVDIEKGIINLKAADTKIRKARSFAISAKLLPQIASRLGDGRAYLFHAPGEANKALSRGGNKRAWATCKRRAKVKCRFHDLRHTALTKAFKTSTNPALICHYAGLSLEVAQNTYLHFTVDDTKCVSELVK